MLTSYDRTQWKEDVTEVWDRDRIHAKSSEPTVRKHYPYKAIIKKSNPAYNLKAGDIISYARTRHVPQYYPIEAVTYGLEGKGFRILYFNSEEAQVMEI